LPLGQERGVGEGVRAPGRCGGQRVRDDRQHHRARASAQRRGGQKDGDEAIGRSRGGLSTKIHATVDALGNPTGFALSPGQAHDLEGADALLPGLAADTLIADKAFDADERVLKPLAEAGKTAVIPPKGNRKEPRPYDRDLYKARHLIENFFARLKQFRAIATRYDKRAVHSSVPSTSPPASSGSIEDRP
jgi:transposase